MLRAKTNSITLKKHEKICKCGHCGKEAEMRGSPYFLILR